MEDMRKVHFIGIGGYGMSAIARVLLDWGYEVSGSDIMPKELTDKLAARGAKIIIGHAAENIAGADFVVYSTDIPKDNIEINSAIVNDIPLIHRSEMLAKILNTKEGITVAGAHGKTSTSSMIAYVMEKGGQDPTFIIGGEVLELNSNAKAGSSPYVVAEADESDGSFLNYYPHIAVITNIEADHLENYDGKFDNLKDSYRKHLDQIKESGLAVINIDDEHLAKMAGQIDPAKLVTFGKSQAADYAAMNITQIGQECAFDIYQKEDFLAHINLRVPGVHNAMNALAAIIVCLRIGMDMATIKEHIQTFVGAKRRFNLMGDANGITIVDDYAHHPTEIRATLAAAKATGKNVVAVFQPQRYTRTFFLFNDFAQAFADADELYVLDIYSPAGEDKIDGVSAEKLTVSIREQSNEKAKYISDKDLAFEELKDKLKTNDLVITMGAGDIWKLAVRLADHISQAKD